MKIKKIMHYIFQPDRWIIILNRLNISKYICDEKYLKLMYKVNFNKNLNLDNPKTFNEKLQWLKLHDRQAIYTTMVDKIEAKKYVASIIGEEYIVPTLGVWDNFNEIEFDKLPKKFVLKCNHDSGGLVIVKDKSQFDKRAAKAKIEKSLKKNFYWSGREWPYKNVKPRVFAEEYIEDKKTHELRDYKFFAFRGTVRLMYVATDRQNKGSSTKFDFYDNNFVHLNIKNGHDNANVSIEKPQHFEKMISLAEKLSFGVPHLRVDFYEANGKVYFGEMTFYHYSGFVPFEPDDWDMKIGEMIIL